MLKRKFVLIFIFITLLVAISVFLFGRLIDQKMSEYVTEEVNKVSKALIREILNDEFFEEVDLDDLFIINKNSDGEIEMIDLNTVKVNNVLGKINEEIIYYFGEFDHGNTTLIKKYSSLFQRYTNRSESGLFINIPLGIIFTNPIVISIGPKIPIKMLLSGQVESDISTSIKQYGINNVLLEIDADIKVREKIIFPFSSHYVDVKLKVPLIIELISGKIPENFLNSQNSDIIK